MFFFDLAPMKGNKHRDISQTGWGRHPSRTYKTGVKRKTLNPIWNDANSTFEMEIRGPINASYLRVSLFDQNEFPLADQLMAEVSV